MTRAITDLLVISGDEVDPAPPGPGWRRIPVDLSASDHPRHTYLYYRRDGDGDPITDVKIVSGRAHRPVRGYAFVRGYDADRSEFVDRPDLGEGGGGPGSYLTYGRGGPLPVLDLVVQARQVVARKKAQTPLAHAGRTYTLSGQLAGTVSGDVLLAQLVAEPDPDPPYFPWAQEPAMTEAYLRQSRWEIGRAQVAIDRLAVWVRTVSGTTEHYDGSAPLDRLCWNTIGMDRNPAEAIVREWGLAVGADFTFDDFGAAVNTALGTGHSPATTFATSGRHHQEVLVQVEASADAQGWCSLMDLTVVDLLTTCALGGHSDGATVRSFPDVWSVSYQKTTEPSPDIWVDAPASSVYSAVSPVHSGKYLEVAGSRTQNGEPVTQSTGHGGSNQQWMLEYVPGEDICRIRVRHSGKYLDVAGMSVGNGAPVHQWEGWDGPNQKWRMLYQPDGSYAFQSVHSGKFLDVAGGRTEDGTGLIQWDWHGGENQRFRLGPWTAGEHGLYVRR